MSTDQRIATSSGLLLLGIAGMLAADRAGAIQLGIEWSPVLLCALAGGLLLARSESGSALYAGVASRTGRHVWILRAAVLVLAPLAGAGVLAYAAVGMVQALQIRPPEAPVDWRRTAGTGFIGLGVVLAARQAGLIAGSDGLFWSILLAGAGLSLYWGSAGTKPGPDPDSATDDRRLRSQLALLLAMAAAAYVLDRTGLFDQAGRTIVGAAIAGGVLALVVGPRWLRTYRLLQAERIERARAQERADLADHLHDSVLQTLALIQRNADDSEQVRGLAHSQERALRARLLGDEMAEAPTSIGTALRAVAAAVEDSHRAAINVVIVGDAPLDDRSEALVAAAGEALTNAAKHAREGIALFAEIEKDDVSVWVRDRGPGFDLDAIPADRRGVRESIVGRMERHGGEASVRTARGAGCEVRLTLERQS